MAIRDRSFILFYWNDVFFSAEPTTFCAYAAKNEKNEWRKKTRTIASNDTAAAA